MQTSVDQRPNGKHRARYRLEATDDWITVGTFTNKTLARRAIAEVRLKEEEGILIDARKGRTKLDTFVVEHVWPLKITMKLEPATIDEYKRMYKFYIEPTFGSKELRSIREEHVLNWLFRFAIDPVDGPSETSITSVKSPGKPLGDSQIWKIYFLLKEILRRAAGLGYMARTPCPEDTPVRMPITQRAERWLTNHELKLLAECTPTEQDMVFIYLLGYSGLRISEAAALRVNDIDFVRKTITVDEVVVEHKGKLSIRPYPKNDNSRRTLGVPQNLMTLLRDLLSKRKGLTPEAMVFTGQRGKTLRPSNWTPRVFEKAVEKAHQDGLTPHHLRHTAATMWVDLGASLLQIARRLGHRDTTMVERVYGHLYPEAEDRLMDQLDAVFETADAGKQRVVSIHRAS